MKPEDVTYYFEIDGWGVGDDDKPCPAGLSVRLRDCKKPPKGAAARKAAEKLAAKAVAEMLSTPLSAVHPITKAQYIKRGYTDDEEPET